MLFSKKNRELGVTEIAQELGMYKSTVHRILTTMENRGFLQKNPKNNKYWIGLKIFSLGMYYSKNIKFRDIARPFAQKLADKYMETVHIAVIDFDKEEGPEVVVVDKIQKAQFLSMTPPIGSSSPAHCSAMGKVLLSYSKPSILKEIIKRPLKKYTDNTITSVERLLEELSIVRKCGYAIDDEELEIGLTCVAAPIFDFDNEVVASISLSGPTPRLKPRIEKEIIEDVKSTAMEISRKLR